MFMDPLGTAAGVLAGAGAAMATSLALNKRVTRLEDTMRDKSTCEAMHEGLAGQLCLIREDTKTQLQSMREATTTSLQAMREATTTSLQAMREAAAESARSFEAARVAAEKAVSVAQVFVTAQNRESDNWKAHIDGRLTELMEAITHKPNTQLGSNHVLPKQP
jgi:hypothetical protein